MDFINYTIIPGSNFMKRITPFHFCRFGIWQITAKIFNPFFYSYQFTFGEPFQDLKHSRSEFNRILHLLKSELFPNFLGSDIITRFSKCLFGIFNVDKIFNLLKQFKLLNRNQSSNFLAPSGKDYGLITISNLVNKIGKILSGICGRNCGHGHCPLCFLYIVYSKYSWKATLNKIRRLQHGAINGKTQIGWQLLMGRRRQPEQVS